MSKHKNIALDGSANALTANAVIGWLHVYDKAPSKPVLMFASDRKAAQQRMNKRGK